MQIIQRIPISQEQITWFPANFMCPCIGENSNDGSQCDSDGICQINLNPGKEMGGYILCGKCLHTYFFVIKEINKERKKDS